MKQLITLGFLVIILPLTAQNFRNYSNEFLNIGVDAASLGMSKSVVATTNNVNAIYWNPAGLSDVDDYQGSLMHASYFAGIANYNFAAFAMPVDAVSSLGFSIIRFGVDDILNTTELIDGQGNINYDKISLFSAADYAFTIAYSRNIINKNLYLGVNTKIIRRVIGDFADSWGFGFDLGLQFKRKEWQFGLVVRDITTTYNTWSINQEKFDLIKAAIPGENQELPEKVEITKPKIQLGVARKFRLGKNFKLATELDLNMRFAQTNDLISAKNFSIEPTFGLQLDYSNFVFLRAGIGNIQNTTEFDDTSSITFQPNIGLGFVYKGIQIDYALTNIGSVGNALFSNIFSIKFDYAFYR
ncbi:putative type IX sorting system protein PorV2 [Polaribacter pacificus]|uniref:putative type IX sorting system protein PorV2 n=1 Tax=Polaribacter pacificus TaxID=1775173 RepID=UPI0040329520